ncbi:putative lipid II flippase FtsW [Paenibacillus sp. y28]|uniref:putative lipid II flippase FtsW n=1 Tax=Paenibacillus sp. y28 TaxID=3129110 RepID=UPI0030181166
MSRGRGTPDFLLLFLTFLLVGFGIIMVFSASSMMAVSNPKFLNDALYFTKKQVLFAGLGTVGMLALMNIPFQRLKRFFIPYFAVVVVLLFTVLFIAEETKGAKSWLPIFGSFQIQPTEFAKLAVILYLSSLIQKKGERFRDFQKGLLPVLIILGFVCGLIMLQPDFGSCMILLSCALIVIIAGGADLKQLFVTGGILGGISGLFSTLYLLTSEDGPGYRVARLTSYLNPWEDRLGDGYQLIQSLYALGHGGFTGTGIGQSIQKLHYLPEPHNDFIFAIIGEELGFLGSFLFLTVYLLFIWRGFIVALRSPDIQGTLIGIGIMGLVAVQALINIGGVTGTIPITGVTLPFISYGGSSLLVMMASMGILLSISREATRESASEKKKRA